MGSIFGPKQKSSSSSTNQAFGTLNQWAQPLMQYSGQGAGGLASLLGGDSSGFNAYKDATGFGGLLEEGSRGITGNRAAGGSLRSGATGKSLVNYGNQMQNQYAGDYMNQLASLAGLGSNAAGILGGAGGTSQSSSKSSDKSGLGKMIGSAASMAAMSDRRLKRDIVNIGKTKEGLNLYEYYYTYNPFFKQTGVMADEVALYKPEALGPVVNGYMSVDYSKLEI